MLSHSIILTGKFITHILQRFKMSQRRRCDIPRRRPFDSIAQDHRDVVTIKGRIFLMTGTEVEDFAKTAVVAAAASEMPRRRRTS